MASVALCMAAVAPAHAQEQSLVARYGDDQWTIDYDFAGNITSVRVDPEFNSLVFTIATSSEQDLVLNLPRSLVDARANEIDSEFLVVAGGQPLQYAETQNTETMRQIRVTIPPATTELEIVGTRVAPEFHILAVTVGSILIMVTMMVRVLQQRRFMA